jgi:outer membrane immunogenic protein
LPVLRVAEAPHHPKLWTIISGETQNLLDNLTCFQLTGRARSKVRRVIMRRLAAAFVTASLGWGSASAAELPPDVYAPAYGRAFIAPVPVVYNWTGLYLGAHVGGAWGNSRWIFVPVNEFGLAFPGADLLGNSLSGAYGGGQLGYNYQLRGSSWVFGWELDSSFGHIRRSMPAVPAFVGVLAPGQAPLVFAGQPVPLGTLAFLLTNAPFSLTPTVINTTGDMDYLGSLRLRLGYAVDRLLLYSTLGMAWTHDKITLVTPAIAPFSFSNTQTHFGVAVGAGVEYAFLNNFSARVEYLYTSYTHADTYFPDVISGGIGVKANVQAVRGGINYLFQYPR